MTGATARPPIRCAGGVVIEDGRLLLVQRAEMPEQGRWSLPGGRVEPGEPPEETVRREVAEETGLEVEVGGICGSVRLRHGEVDYDITDFYAERVSGTPVAGDDALALRFVTTDELVGLPLSRGLYDFLEERGVLGRLRADGGPVRT